MSESECVFCRQAMRSGKLLMCLHAACVKCLRTVPRSGADRKSIACALCCEQTRLPSENPDDVLHLPNNLLLAASVRRAAALAERLVCGECVGDTAQATHTCVTCGELLCELHSSVHPISRGTVGHGVQPLSLDSDSDSNTVPGAGVADEIRLPLCLHHAFPVQDIAQPPAPAHSRSPSAGSSATAAATFCITCGEVLCASCHMEATHGDGDHELVGTAQAERQQRGELCRMLPEVTADALPRLRSGETQVNTALREFDSSILSVRTGIEDTVDKLLKRIRLEEAHLLRELDAFHAEKRGVLKAQATTIASALEKTDRATRLGRALLDEANGARFLHDGSWVLDSLYDVVSKMPACDDIISDADATATSSVGAASLAAAVATMNPFEDPPSAADFLGSRNPATVSLHSNGDSAMASLSLPSGLSLHNEQLTLEPICEPRISFVDYSEKLMAEKALVGVLSMANIDPQQCSLRPLEPPAAGGMYGAGDRIRYVVRLVSADAGGPVPGADEVGLEVKAVVATTDTVSELPCDVAPRPGAAGEFLVTFSSPDAAEVLLYASIDQRQLPLSPAQVTVGCYPLRFDAKRAARGVRVAGRGYAAAVTTSADSVVLGDAVYCGGEHRWRVQVSGLEGPDFVAVGVARQPFPTNFGMSVTSYPTVLAWSSRSQTLIKGAFCKVNMEAWRNGDTIEVRVDYGKRSLTLVNCRTSERSTMNGAIRSDVVPFFYMFSKKHVLRMMAQPRLL